MTPISCQEALQRLYEYLDGELAPPSAEEVERHLHICQGCYPEVRITTEFREAVHRAARGQPGCPDALRRRIATLLEAERQGEPRDRGVPGDPGGSGPAS